MPILPAPASLTAQTAGPPATGLVIKEPVRNTVPPAPSGKGQEKIGEVPSKRKRTEFEDDDLPITSAGKGTVVSGPSWSKPGRRMEFQWKESLGREFVERMIDDDLLASIKNTSPEVLLDHLGECVALMLNEAQKLAEMAQTSTTWKKTYEQAKKEWDEKTAKRDKDFLTKTSECLIATKEAKKLRSELNNEKIVTSSQTSELKRLNREVTSLREKYYKAEQELSVYRDPSYVVGIEKRAVAAFKGSKDYEQEAFNYFSRGVEHTLRMAYLSGTPLSTLANWWREDMYGEVTRKAHHAVPFLPEELVFLHEEDKIEGRAPWSPTTVDEVNIRTLCPDLPQPLRPDNLPVADVALAVEPPQAVPDHVCRKCAVKKLTEEDSGSCPVCNTVLGVAPLKKLSVKIADNVEQQAEPSSNPLHLLSDAAQILEQVVTHGDR